MTPSLTNNERLRILAHAVYGARRYQKHLQGVLGCDYYTMKMFELQAKTPRGAKRPHDETIQLMIDYARQRRAEIDQAIEDCRLPPWIK